MRTTLRSWLLRYSSYRPVWACLQVLACGATAVGAPAAQEADVIEEVVVTGTRIQRLDFISANPIVSLDAEVFARAGAPTVERVLNLAPQFVPSYTETSNNPGIGGGAYVSLRGLGTVRTLVLLDGRRVVSNWGDGSIDLNIVPPALIESVEIVTGGATAVYGSDAIAGVVNMKLKHDFRGVRLDGSWGQTAEGDGEQQDLGLTFGSDFAAGRGEFVGYFGRTDRHQVDQGDRDFSRYSLFHYGPGTGGVGPGGEFLPQGSSIIEEGTALGVLADPVVFDALFEGYGHPAGSVPYQSRFAFNADGSLFTQGNFAPGSVANFRGEQDPVLYNDRRYTWNYAPTNALRLPLERDSAYLMTGFDLDAATRVYLQALYAGTRASQQLAPTPAVGVFVPPTNPHVPADLARLLGSRPNADSPFVLNKRLSELGPRISEVKGDNYQLVLGLTHEFASGWSAEAYLQYGESSSEGRAQGNASLSRLEELTFAADGGAAACGGFDPFGAGSISAECAAYIAVDAGDQSSYELGVVEGTLSGTLLTLPAGDVELVLGALYREDRLDYRVDAASKAQLPDGRFDLLGFFGSDDLGGDTTEYDLYAEVLVPLLANRRWAESLETVLGYRYADYTSAGGTDAWKTELLYRPLAPLLLRGSFQRAVRAPSVVELYAPQVPTIPGFDHDPCEAGSPERSGADGEAIEGLCLAQGLPTELLPVFAAAWPSGLAGGNPELGTESADTHTAGVVWESPLPQPWLSGLQVSLDWYRIRIEDTISTLAASTFVERCYSAEFNPQFAADNYWCGFFGRDGTTGDIRDALEIQMNLGYLETSGIDLQLDWSMPAGPGTVHANLLLSWIDYWRSRQDRGSLEEERAGTIGAGFNAVPEWKSNLGVDYAQGAFQCGLRWYWADRMTSYWTQFDDYPGEFEVPAYDRVDLWASYAFERGALQGLVLRLGIDNLGDEDPPIYPDYIQANTDPSQYDVLGRRGFLAFSYAL